MPPSPTPIRPSDLGASPAPRARRPLRELLLVLLAFCALLVPACGGERAPDDAAARRSSAGYGDGFGGDDATRDPRAAATPDVPADAPLVTVLGDSISAGLHLAASDAWPARLQRLLVDEGLPVRLQNAGVSGDTSAGGLARLDWILGARPDVVVVELGGNDGLRGQPLASIETNLRAIVQKISAAGARPVLVAMRIPTNYGPEYTRDFAAIYPRLADALDVPLVDDFLDGVGGVPAMNLPDGIHPTPEGHERLAQNALDTLEDVVRQVLVERGSSGG
ncbi:MAG: arylesterase [Planctomycetes bacterium]|nr:arylesterase [Planctomycetota bacterium]